MCILKACVPAFTLCKIYMHVLTGVNKICLRPKQSCIDDAQSTGKAHPKLEVCRYRKALQATDKTEKPEPHHESLL